MRNRSVIAALCFTLTCEIASAAPLVAYGSSDAVLPAKNQELFLMGFEAGFESMLGRGAIRNVLVEQKADGAALAAAAIAEHLAKAGVRILAGFPTSHEALLVAPICVKKNLLCIFAGAGHSKLRSFGPNIVTTGESMSYSVATTLRFLLARYGEGNFVTIVNPYAVFSRDFADALVLAAKNPKFSRLKIIPIRLTRELFLTESAIADVKKLSPKAIVMSQYADESVRLLEQLERVHLDLPFVANSSWTTGDIEFIRRFLADKHAPVFSQALWSKGAPAVQGFEKLIKERYGRDPTTEIMHGFDVGALSAQVVRTMSRTAENDPVTQFYKARCYAGTATGSLCFENSGGYGNRKLYTVRFTKNGFVAQ